LKTGMHVFLEGLWVANSRSSIRLF
jgi:hypothetical protein